MSLDFVLGGLILSTLAPTSWRVVSGQTFQNTINQLRNKIGNVACSRGIVEEASISALIHPRISCITVVNNLLQD
jgi:uncharacterized protein YjeT (DUF2065 family)